MELLVAASDMVSPYALLDVDSAAALLAAISPKTDGYLVPLKNPWLKTIGRIGDSRVEPLTLLT